MFVKDGNGYYVYNSSLNYAYYNNDGTRNFTVYNVPAAPDGDADCYNIGNFFPFNVLAGDSRIKDNSTGLRNFETGTGATPKNTHFGMTMSASFVQPAEGKVNDQNMVFNFTGDDDVWVFIDGVLVLDIGGIHDALSGSIDFNTGTVTVTGQSDTNLKQLFELAGKDTSEGFTGNTFSGYTEHTINFYYLERGEGASNCKLEFNIQTIPEDSVIVEKQLGVSGIENNQEFTFKAETSEDGNTWNVLPKGTEFTITNSNGETSGTGTIGANGTFQIKAGQRAVFENIVAGTFFRATETQNSNYTTSVQITGQDAEVNGLTGKLTVREGINRILFINTPKSSSLLNYDKNASEKDYNNRVYEINLTAGTLGSTAGTEGESASIVLVLDASSSLSNTTFSALKTAAKSFINTASQKVSADNSGDIEIAVVWYNGTQGSNTTATNTSSSGFQDVSTENGVNSLNTHIDNKWQYGGTPMGDGLHAAQNLLENAQYANKYVLLFTDGLPGHNDYDRDFNCMVANDAYSRATTIKSKNTTIYTVGYGSGLNENFYWEPGHSNTSQNNHGYHSTTTSGTKFLEDYIATSGCAFHANDTEELNNIFNDIVGDIGSNLTTETEKIVDVVDQRFDLLIQDESITEEQTVWTDEDGKTYRKAKAGDYITDSAGNSGIVAYNEDTGVYTITWSKVVIANVNDGGWSASFYVKAKEDFIGGNVIPTNGTESGIYLPGDDVINFPMPTVNVMLLNLQSENKEVTFFKGETVNPKDFIQELLNNAEVVQLVTGSDGQPVTMPVSDIIESLTDDQLEELIDEKEVTVAYSYGTTNDQVGTFKLQFAVKDGGDLSAHPLLTVGDDVEQYVLTINYTAKTVAERISDTSEWKEPEGAEVTSVSTQPEYSISVVAGSIVVRKTVSVEDLKAALEESGSEKVTFTFNITGTNRYNPTYSSDVTISFTQDDLNQLEPGTTEITHESQAVTELAQDTYTVSEANTNGFEAQMVTAGGRTGSDFPIKEAQVDSTNLTAALYVGLPNTESDYLNYRDGEITFTNSKVTNNWQIVKVSSTNHDVKLSGAMFELSTSDGSKTYVGTSVEGTGVVAWTLNNEAVTKLDKGIYTLKETKAPTGYQCSNVEWTVEITASGALKSITSNDQSSIITVIDDNGMVSYFYQNEALFDLPSSGGSGIFGYTMGGTLLLMAGTLILYKMKRKEVQES